MNWATAVSPNAVIIANAPSPSAAPRPDTNPFTGPKANVRRIQMRFTGPIGAATMIPITTPERIVTINSMASGAATMLSCIHVNDEPAANVAGKNILRGLEHVFQRNCSGHRCEFPPVEIARKPPPSLQPPRFMHVNGLDAKQGYAAQNERRHAGGQIHPLRKTAGRDCAAVFRRGDHVGERLRTH